MISIFLNSTILPHVTKIYKEIKSKLTDAKRVYNKANKATILSRVSLNNKHFLGMKYMF